MNGIWEKKKEMVIYIPSNLTGNVNNRHEQQRRFLHLPCREKTEDKICSSRRDSSRDVVSFAAWIRVQGKLKRLLPLHIYGENPASLLLLLKYGETPNYLLALPSYGGKPNSPTVARKGRIMKIGRSCEWGVEGMRESRRNGGRYEMDKGIENGDEGAV
jgi:hypothetical protein